ncbi:hypothetical protein G7K_0756-t1 [Saitoella complicata NRRL Y-17804]|uniref:Uncharacterized protein n=1 Tax=Saitoella complicata (strain BCRC 22490 / CBS 7301 / JCM 7358 / NBRC 10748 / NRRL Y-17804) TaxID=698492 RepID=A0A0E9NA00_SAICN|nr:hypothetical protein G7K_0756-t1 [Saitoella complicata NRRL Y-17804]
MNEGLQLTYTQEQISNSSWSGRSKGQACSRASACGKSRMLFKTGLVGSYDGPYITERDRPWFLSSPITCKNYGGYGDVLPLTEDQAYFYHP